MTCYTGSASMDPKDSVIMRLSDLYLYINYTKQNLIRSNSFDSHKNIFKTYHTACPTVHI